MGAGGHWWIEFAVVEALAVVDLATADLSVVGIQHNMSLPELEMMSQLPQNDVWVRVVSIFVVLVKLLHYRKNRERVKFEGRSYHC